MGNRILRTKLCDLLEIEYPIILAGMGEVARASLVAAVSNAGGLGVIGGFGMSPDTLREEIRQVRRLTNKPFGVDLILPINLPEARASSSVPQPQDQPIVRAELPADQVDFVKKLKSELGLRERIKGQGESGRGISWRNIAFDVIKKNIDVILEERVPVFASGLGNPGFMVPDAHAVGMKVLAVVGNVKNARRVADAGVDVVVAQGYDAGGHTGRIGTLALIPQVVDAVFPTLVAAAGGIADGRGLAAALALGAFGVWIGTAFIPTLESAAPEEHKRRILEMTEEDTRVSKSFSGKPMRVLTNAWVEAWDRGPVPPLPMPYQGMLPGLTGILLATEDGKDLSAMPTGQIGGLIKQIKPAGQVVQEMVEGAIKVLRENLRSEVEIG
ncbi:MAG: nitronate monooxygenase family protein [Dehalococcoidia bacterium]|nr:nitronate monooxygenase family protein [Dehalococcoidia bacterium]